MLGAINSKNIIDKINNSKFDAIVDLNQSHNQNFSFILMDLTIPIKVGFQDEFSNYLYTITIQSKSIGFLEENFIMIEKNSGFEIDLFFIFFKFCFVNRCHRKNCKLYSPHILEGKTNA